MFQVTKLFKGLEGQEDSASSGEKQDAELMKARVGDETGNVGWKQRRVLYTKRQR